MRTYHCKRIIGKTGKPCGRVIPPLRAASRLAQKKKPLYCSEGCVNAVTSKRNRDKSNAA